MFKLNEMIAEIQLNIFVAQFEDRLNRIKINKNLNRYNFEGNASLRMDETPLETRKFVL